MKADPTLFDAIMDWSHHPQALLALSFVITAYLGSNGSPLLAMLFVAALLAPFMALILFIPYMLCVLLLAFSLALMRFLFNFLPSSLLN